MLVASLLLAVVQAEISTCKEVFLRFGHMKETLDPSQLSHLRSSSSASIRKWRDKVDTIAGE